MEPEKGTEKSARKTGTGKKLQRKKIAQLKIVAEKMAQEIMPYSKTRRITNPTKLNIT